MTTTATPTTGAPRPLVRPITKDDVYESLHAGWLDFRAAPQFGLFFGAVYALCGIAIFLELWRLEQPLWIVPLALAFPLIGPFLAIGLYEVSRRREAGEPLDWAGVLGVIWAERNRQMPMMAFVMLAGFLIWMWFARLILAIFLGRMRFAVYSDIDILFTTGAGLGMLVVGTLVGGAIALALFSVTAVSLPLLLDREVDFVTAMATSVEAVKRNPLPMLTWALVIAVSLAAAMVPFFLGLLVALPVLGHATWHLYRRVIAPLPHG
ncbi:DUF2189 domain-containing protein [Amaricoccus sp.]|uniref:DUF2189 domain-containing protein n=1 Tax=Amaricoccus sp. TaxID=1872485 RepID=UPI001B40A246|nr:DUF2189 domain-containing protein [Amaricoccus sp.]MBP7001474.1 DUF2189 domain-containing protein [Amaricoccus sp.]